MPILDKMNRNNTPDGDDAGDLNGKSQLSFSNVPNDKPKRARPTPRFVESRMGRRQISMAALLERMADQFHAEHTPDDSKIREAATRSERIKLLLPVVDYVMGVESVIMDDATKADIMRSLYSELFGFGPLDPLIDDETITTITLEGAEKISVRYGHGELEPINIIFEDESHLKDVVGRLLQRSGASLLENLPLIEVGCLGENGRFISVSMAAPPITTALSLDIRLHPVESPMLLSLMSRGTLDERGVKLLKALVQSEHGFMVVGQPESGKTMTLSAMLAELPNPSRAIAVERTGEMHLPEGMTRVVAEWPQDYTSEGVTFGEQIEAHHKQNYAVMILDEVRADEPHTIRPLLSMENPPRLIWSVRGAPDSKRLVSALGMLARRSDESAGELLVRNLFERMPFVVSVRRLNERIELREVGEWYYAEDEDYVRYRALMQNIGGEFVMTGEKPDHSLPGLADDFWAADA